VTRCHPGAERPGAAPVAAPVGEGLEPCR
jgi:hypothetical protein